MRKNIIAGKTGIAKKKKKGLKKKEESQNASNGVGNVDFKMNDAGCKGRNRSGGRCLYRVASLHLCMM